MLNTCLVTPLLFLLLNLGALNVHLGFVIGCHEADRNSLLKFKESLTYGNNSLSSWEGMDCCNWYGVGCDNVTSRVNSLVLPNHNIKGALPNNLGDLKKLKVLDVSYNQIYGPIPTSIGSMLFLVELVLSHNNLNGIISESMGKCNSLVSIDLSSNFLQGSVLESHFTNLSNLDYLDLSFNHLDLNLNSNWSPPFQLSELYMVSCKIQSSFPQWIGNQSKIMEFDLSHNMISGKLVDRFRSTQLITINLTHNQIVGPIPYFYSSKVRFIDLSYNLLSGPILPDKPYVKNVKLGVPICQLPKLQFLDLQRNKIVGTIPDCWGNSKVLEYINLSSNKLFGIIPMSIGLPPTLRFLKLSNNSLQGVIPPTLSTSVFLEFLDLGENNLIGKIPINSGENYPALKILRLRGNQLMGVIPRELCYLSKLKFIDLAKNNMSGYIPRCIDNLFSMDSDSSEIPLPQVISFGVLKPSDVPPSHKIRYCPSKTGCGRFGGSRQAYTKSPDDNTMVVLKGAELAYTTTLDFVVNLDLSCNALVGSIPKELTKLSALIGLNLSHNFLRGNIPSKIGEMKLLESLDLSNNNLSGTIPSSMSDLTSLIALNLSYNQLHGLIPTGDQLQVIKDPLTAYVGNPGLCGDPLPNKCSSHDKMLPEPEEEEEPNKTDIMKQPLFYFDIFCGFATGFWGVVGSLLLKRRFRWALFQLVGNISDYLYVQVMIRLNKFRY